ncbi:hypothetical protein HU200_012924 [Digitaria exilis]|uniref:Uncharacterized protein n=1 Tax=Digitaria exilis TaxID=1010633 RepID=A0A835KMT3_9POAL|nr:hypothetical protein HU200_012924 [Digitaria exilis]
MYMEPASSPRRTPRLLRVDTNASMYPVYYIYQADDDSSGTPPSLKLLQRPPTSTSTPRTSACFASRQTIHSRRLSGVYRSHPMEGLPLVSTTQGGRLEAPFSVAHRTGTAGSKLMHAFTSIKFDFTYIHTRLFKHFSGTKATLNQSGMVLQGSASKMEDKLFKHLTGGKVNLNKSGMVLQGSASKMKDKAQEQLDGESVAEDGDAMALD